MNSFLFELVTIPLLMLICRNALALKPSYYLIFMCILTLLSLWLMKTDSIFWQDYGRLSRVVCGMEGLIMGLQLIPYLSDLFTPRKNYLQEMPMYCFVSKNWIFSAKNRAKREEYWENYFRLEDKE